MLKVATTFGVKRKLMQKDRKAVDVAQALEAVILCKGSAILTGTLRKPKKALNFNFKIPDTSEMLKRVQNSAAKPTAAEEASAQQVPASQSYARTRCCNLQQIYSKLLDQEADLP